MKKLLLAMGLVFSLTLNASWWGELDGGIRTAIVLTSLYTLNNSYNESEYKHQENLKNLDRDVRRYYEEREVLENAHRKYGRREEPVVYYVVNPNLEYKDNYQKRYENKKVYTNYNSNYNSKGKGISKIVYSDDKTQILEMSDGKRIILNREF